MVGHWLGAAFPFLSDRQALFQFANGGEVLVKSGFVLMTGTCLQAFGVGVQCVENAASFLEALQPLIDFTGAALNEHFPEQRGRLILSWQQRAVAAPGQAAVAAIDVHTEIQCWESGVLA